MRAAGEDCVDSFAVETAGRLLLHDFLLAFVKTGVIPGVVPRHHEILERFVLNYNAISIVTDSNNGRVTDHQPIQDLVYLRHLCFELTPQLRLAVVLGETHPSLHAFFLHISHPSNSDE